MTNIENKIHSFLKFYFSPSDLEIMRKPAIAYGDEDLFYKEQDEYLKICDYYFNLFKLDKDKWYIETDESGSALIDKLLLSYCTSSTLICKTQENYGKVIYDIINNQKNLIYVLNVYNDEEYASLETDTPIQNIINTFKQSKANHLFLFIPHMIPGFGYILKFDFFVRLKKALIANNIKHTLILDDCQASFYINDTIDYELFDSFIISAHLFFPGLSGAVLFTKKQGIAHRSKKFLEEFQPKLDILYKNRNKARQFNTLMNEYFSDIKDDKKILPCINSNYPQHQFILHCKDIKPITKYCKLLYGNYLIRMYEADVKQHWIRVRLDEALMQNPENVIKGLRLYKKYLKIVLRKDDISLDKSYDPSLRTLYDDNSDEFLKKHLAIYKDFYGTDRVNMLTHRIQNTLDQYKTQLLYQQGKER